MCLGSIRELPRVAGGVRVRVHERHHRREVREGHVNVWKAARERDAQRAGPRAELQDPHRADRGPAVPSASDEDVASDDACRASMIGATADASALTAGVHTTPASFRDSGSTARWCSIPRIVHHLVRLVRHGEMSRVSASSTDDARVGVYERRQIPKT